MMVFRGFLLSFLSVIGALTTPRQTIACNHAGMLLVYMAPGPLDHISVLAGFLQSLDCSSQAENFPYIP